MNKHGFVTIATVVPRVAVANPKANVDEILAYLQSGVFADIYLLPELAVSGYTCGDLFAQDALIKSVQTEVNRLATSLRGMKRLVVVGAPVSVDNCLYNAAVVINDGKIIGIVPKQNLPNYREFYEARWFRAAKGGETAHTDYAGFPGVPFGIDLLFNGIAGYGTAVTVGIEICEDLWMPIPPSSFQALAGATVLLNLSASNETVAKNEYRRDLVVQQSGRCIAAYAYTSCGPTESTSDLVFGGHSLVADNGTLVIESKRIGDGSDIATETYDARTEVDVQKLLHDRRVGTSFFNTESAKSFRKIEFELTPSRDLPLLRPANAHPFVPKDKATLDRRCTEIFDIATAGLTKRISRLSKNGNLAIGISGGLDSTAAACTLKRACKQLGCEHRILGITMPGFGTTERTKNNAVRFMELSGFRSKTIDIRPACLQEFKDLGHKPFGIDVTDMTVDDFEAALRAVPKEQRDDLVFENVQARQRTLYLMSSGFVVGTGDMSELALGWATYNGDHMSMYNPNCSIPKTLIKFLVEYIANTETGELRDVLLDIANTTISPELLPPDAEGKIEQSTEDVVGPYEIHDFVLFHTIRNGFTPSKILYLAQSAKFNKEYTTDDLKKWMRMFYRRFFNNQFKRNCVPDGPKVGSVSLSPRGDWRMPSDADSDAWLANLEVTE